MGTAEIIRSRLEQLGWKSKDLAAAVKVSTTAVDYWLEGRTAPNRRRQQQVADALLISIAQLMGNAPLAPARGSLSERALRVAELFDSMSPARQRVLRPDAGHGRRARAGPGRHQGGS